MVLNKEAGEGAGQLEQFEAELKEELEKSRNEHEEISLLLDQSQLEVNKQAHKHASTNAQLQQVQLQFDSLPRDDIRSAYDAALDAQQRLFVMRGQIEKLLSSREFLKCCRVEVLGRWRNTVPHL
jgi:two-component system sensor histidine kinase DegS